MDLINALLALLNVKTAPVYTGDWFVLRCQVDFEPNGRASETWEEHWKLELPKTPSYWQKSNGTWVRGYGMGMDFDAPTMQKVLEKGIYYLSQLKKNEIPTVITSGKDVPDAPPIELI